MQTTRSVWHHDDQMLFEYTKFGGAAYLAGIGVDSVKSAMPGFEEALKDQDIIAILDYIKSTWPEDVQATQRQITESRNQ